MRGREEAALGVWRRGEGNAEKVFVRAVLRAAQVSIYGGHDGFHGVPPSEGGVIVSPSGSVPPMQGVAPPDPAFRKG